jgi:hypothetical protein
MPLESSYDHCGQWHCPVCIYRRWHVQPPTLTPPASLSLPPVQVAVLGTPSTSDLGPEIPRAVSIPAQHAPIASHSLPNQQVANPRSQGTGPITTHPSPKHPPRPLATRQHGNMCPPPPQHHRFLISITRGLVFQLYHMIWMLHYPSSIASWKLPRPSGHVSRNFRRQMRNISRISVFGINN